jgi:hypothetical protein
MGIFLASREALLTGAKVAAATLNTSVKVHEGRFNTSSKYLAERHRPSRPLPQPL